MSEREQAFELSDELAEGYLENLLPSYAANRHAEYEARKAKDGIASLLRQWLEAHPEQVLYNGEAGIEASLRPRKLPGRLYDLTTLAKQDPALFERLLEMGCLQVNDAIVKEQGAQVGGVERYAFPQGETKALVVEVKT